MVDPQGSWSARLQRSSSVFVAIRFQRGSCMAVFNRLPMIETLVEASFDDCDGDDGQAQMCGETTFLNQCLFLQTCGASHLLSF